MTAEISGSSSTLTYFCGLRNKVKPPELDWIPTSTQWAMPLRANRHVLWETTEKWRVKNPLKRIWCFNFLSGSSQAVEISVNTAFLDNSFHAALPQHSITIIKRSSDRGSSGAWLPWLCRETPRHRGGPGAAGRGGGLDLEPPPGRARWPPPAGREGRAGTLPPARPL